MWTHHHKQVEATEFTIAQLNELSNEDVILTLEELHEPRKYIQGTGGNKLSIYAQFSPPETTKKSLKLSHIVDSGSTGSCIHRRVVEEYQIPTKKLPRPIPVYNADGSLNKDGDIKETVTLRMIIQDHEEEITFAVSIP